MPLPEYGNQRLTSEKIQMGLKTRWLGKKKVYCFYEVDSTNIVAKRLALEGAPSGTIVISEAQRKGRGRMARFWLSPKGDGLYFSLILRPDIIQERGQLITFATAVALASSLKERGIDSRIKWPNDILIQERKVAGILMEVSADRNRTAIIVVGVGINVNTSIEAFPPSLRDSVTSLSLNIGRPLSRIRVFQDFLTHFEFWYEVLISERFEDILRAWRGFSSTLGTRVNVTLQEGIISGLAEGIDSQGALLLRDDEGRQHRIIAGDVIHCRPSS